MNDKQKYLYWKRWNAACHAQGWNMLKAANRDEYRHAVHALACGKAASSKSLTNTQISAVFRIFEALANGAAWDDIKANAPDPSRAQRVELCTAIIRMAEYLLMLYEQRQMSAAEARELAEAYVAAAAKDACQTGNWRTLPLLLNTKRPKFAKGDYVPPKGVFGRYDLTNLRNIIGTRLNDRITDIKTNGGSLLGYSSGMPNKAIAALVKRHGPPFVKSQNPNPKPQINPNVQITNN